MVVTGARCAHKLGASSAERDAMKDVATSFPTSRETTRSERYTPTAAWDDVQPPRGLSARAG